MQILPIHCVICLTFQKYPTPRRLCQVFFIKPTEHNVHF